MNPEEALKIIIQATGAVQANRETHLKIQEAIKVIEQELTPEEEKKV